MPGLGPTTTATTTLPSLPTTLSKSGIPCRTCTDFKSWARQQRDIMGNKGNDSNMKPPETESTETMATKHGCPYDKEDLGRSTWGLLHTMAANFPEKPSTKNIEEVSTFFNLLSKYYPCEFCAKDLKSELKKEPVVATTQENFSQWLCRLHNRVNEKIGKPQFDCSLINQRWRDGWNDGSCDT